MATPVPYQPNNLDLMGRRYSELNHTKEQLKRLLQVSNNRLRAIRAMADAHPQSDSEFWALYGMEVHHNSKVNREAWEAQEEFYDLTMEMARRARDQ